MVAWSVAACLAALAAPVVTDRACHTEQGCEALAQDSILLQKVKLHHASSSDDSLQGGTISVMSYNTEYRDYSAMMGGYAAKIREVRPAIVGLQECQNRDGLAGLSHYQANRDTGRQNYMLFDPQQVSFLGGGWMRIPRDNYADRAITWGKFRFAGREIFLFNTHLPHNHGEAASRHTHARIARMFLQKRLELGAEHMPTIVTGDMNSFASDWNRVSGGGFESNLQARGFVNAYTARGHPGHANLDHILYSREHWRHHNCRDTGTGGSDHTSITCDLELL